MTKQERLLKLTARIHDKCFRKGREAWFFPKCSRVKGYLGTGKIAFSGINPSFGHFPSKGDEFFYKSLKKFGFENAHITDLIKHRLTNKEAKDLKIDSPLLLENLTWLKKELRILGNDVTIIAIGKKAHKLLRAYFGRRVSDTWLRHYAWVEKYSASARRRKRMKFQQALRRIRKEMMR
jgi:hypothetical protein